MMNVGEISEIKTPMFKAITAWAAALGTSTWQIWYQLPWDRFAQFAAFIYSLCLIWEYACKKRLKERRKEDRKVYHDSE